MQCFLYVSTLRTVFKVPVGRTVYAGNAGSTALGEQGETSGICKTHRPSSCILSSGSVTRWLAWARFAPVKTRPGCRLQVRVHWVRLFFCERRLNLGRVYRGRKVLLKILAFWKSDSGEALKYWCDWNVLCERSLNDVFLLCFWMFYHDHDALLRLELKFGQLVFVCQFLRFQFSLVLSVFYRKELENVL